jgi:peroxiredoxin
MRRKPTLFFTCVGLLCGYLIYSQSLKTGQPGIVAVGDPAPEFSIKDENGHEVRLSDFRGKTVFLNFWATWCGPCIKEAPEIEIVHNMFKDRNFQMITISSDTSWRTVHSFQEKHGLTFPVFLDPGQQVSRYTYKTTGWPETFLIDPNGVIVQHTFAAHWASAQALSQIESLSTISAVRRY